MYLLVLILISCVLSIFDGLVTCGTSFPSKGRFFCFPFLYIHVLFPVMCHMKIFDCERERERVHF